MRFQYAYHVAESAVYHREDGCPIGSAITVEERQGGKGDELLLCPECKAIGDRRQVARPRRPTFGKTRR